MRTDVFVYIFAAKTGDAKSLIKVGMASDVDKRRRTLQTSCPYEIETFHIFTCPNRTIAGNIERAFHVTQANRRSFGEWFNLDPSVALIFMVMNFEAALPSNFDSDEIEMIKSL